MWCVDRKGTVFLCEKEIASNLVSISPRCEDKKSAAELPSTYFFPTAWCDWNKEYQECREGFHKFHCAGVLTPNSLYFYDRHKHGDDKFRDLTSFIIVVNLQTPNTFRRYPVCWVSHTGSSLKLVVKDGLVHLLHNDSQSGLNLNLETGTSVHYAWNQFTLVTP